MEIVRTYCDQLEQAMSGNLDAGQVEHIMSLSRQRLLDAPHGDQARWLKSLGELPAINAQVDADAAAVSVNAVTPERCNQEVVRAALRGLMPWRKGPFRFFGVDIDTEWRSDWKWQRVEPHVADLAGRRVLDVGCGSGYHCWRMAAKEAAFVLGIDPTILFLVQYLAIKQYTQMPVWFAPLRLEQLAPVADFDTVFSMGVLYHRRSPFDHLQELFQLLRPGGELVLETLTIEGGATSVLVPEDRYAMMRNVYFLPSEDMLAIWLRKAGFTNVRVVDVSLTDQNEQRSTEWMQFQSLPNFLDPDDNTLTREGYPAPRRAVLVANRPN